MNRGVGGPRGRSAINVPLEDRRKRAGFSSCDADSGRSWREKIAVQRV